MSVEQDLSVSVPKTRIFIYFGLLHHESQDIFSLAINQCKDQDKYFEDVH